MTKIKHLFSFIVAIFAITSCSAIDSSTGDPLDGTSWKLTAYRRTSPIEGSNITANFEDGQVRGSSSCNSYSGSYQIDGDIISVSQVVMTEMACLDPEGIMEQESIFLSMLGEADSFKIVDDQLTILSSNGEALTFIPQE